MIDDWTAVSTLLPSFGIRLAAAILCGILLGMERERKDKPAGLRTILLITVGSTLYMLVSNLIPLAVDWPTDVTRADPSRIAAQVVSGIGFLGAGTIIQARGAIHGLTTAAVIWVAAGIGLCCGLGFPLLAVLITLIVLAALIVMDPIRDWLTRSGEKDVVTLLAPNDELAMLRVRYLLESHDIAKQDITYEPVGDEVRVRFQFHATGDAGNRLMEALAGLENVHGPRFQGGDAPSAASPPGGAR